MHQPPNPTNEKKKLLNENPVDMVKIMCCTSCWYNAVQ